MHDRVEGVRLQHHRQVVQLDYPDAALRERLGDIRDERARVLEVVEHRDARDRLGLLVWTALVQCPRRVEVVDDVVSLCDGISGHVGGVETEVAQPFGLVPIEERSIVAADVDDEITGLQRHDCFDPARDAVEILRHRAVDSAAIPVGAVEDRTGDRVLGLYETACFLVACHVAADEFERDRPLDRLRAAGIGERSGDALLAE